MNKQEFETFLQVYRKIDDIVDDIVEYLGKNFWTEKWSICENEIFIYYGYQCYGESIYECESIPIDNIINGTWKEYLKEKEERKKRELEEKERLRLESEKDKRKKMYEELKKEFEQ